MAEHFTLKLTVVGDPGVGKTSLITRFVENRFTSDYISTLGVDFLVKNTTLEDNTTAKMVIWDIGGQETWKSKLNLYLKGANGAIIICDSSRLQTCKNIESWLEHLQKHAGDIPYCVIGNKDDLPEKKVKMADLKKYSNNQPCFFSSAKSGKNVETTFNTIAKMMIEKLKSG